MSERKLLALCASPIAVYELYALRTRKKQTISTVVRTSSKWERRIVGAAIVVLFTHLFFGRP